MKIARRLGRKGFTLIELLVVVLIIGILAAIAVPQYFKVVEKGKAAEAFQWLASLKGAQERYLAKNGAYLTGAMNPATSFDVNLGDMKYFTPAASLTAGTGAPGYAITLTRRDPAGGSACPAVYGCYVLTYDRNANPSISCNQTDCTADLLP